jgi:hypothetical protein
MGEPEEIGGLLPKGLSQAVALEPLPYAVTKSCYFGSLSKWRASDGDLLACRDIGTERDSMLSLTLIFRNLTLLFR